MTSKEALKILFASYHYDGNYQDVIEAREKLEQDLERLRQLEYVMLLIVDYGLIDIDKLENVMYYAEFEAMKKAFNEAEDKIKRSDYDK